MTSFARICSASMFLGTWNRLRATVCGFSVCLENKKVFLSMIVIDRHSRSEVADIDHESDQVS